MYNMYNINLSTLDLHVLSESDMHLETNIEKSPRRKFYSLVLVNTILVRKCVLSWNKNLLPVACTVVNVKFRK